jgi:hypothetical protein
MRFDLLRTAMILAVLVESANNVVVGVLAK